MIYPPVDASEITAISDWASRTDEIERAWLDQLPTDFVLGASRLVPYKSLDVVMQVGEALGVPVVVAGDGPDRNRLEVTSASLTVPVTFAGRVSNTVLRALYQRALVYVFPPVEDFGIMPVEAMAAGAGVMVNWVGGASESVIDGVSGAHFDPADKASYVSAAARAARVAPEAARRRSLDFDRRQFEERIRAWADV